MLDLENLRAARHGPPKPTRVRRPIGYARSAGVERYFVVGRGAVLVEVSAGDQLSITNDEGAQVGELLAAHPDGRVDPGLVGAPVGSPADGLRDLLKFGNDSLRRLSQGLKRRGIDMGDALAVHLFDAATPSGAERNFVAQGSGFVVLAAPAGTMDVSGQNTATPLTLVVTRANASTRPLFDLPEPLADPVLDLRVKSSTAEAYRIAAGQYFQIIDVDGRQCTDFQCFDARKLDRGIAHPLDVTTTRTLQHHAYPMPGLHGKYFDQDMTPLVEVIQDTCGRHDAFAMACAAKYYDDIGYPGHANCSDNFNDALAAFDVPARPGWMAANFFFNTSVDAHGLLLADEPWSRPGDYVLLRALTDIVCVSSACPDDTSAANGWDLTDIHIRAYDGAERFQRASAWRASPHAEPIMTRETAFHQKFSAMTRDFVEYKGFWLPSSFPQTDATEAYWACREGVVAMDLSALRKFEITGPDAEALMNWVLTRNIEKLGLGQVVYSAMCYEHGGMIDDGTLFRLGPQNFRWIGGSDEGGDWMRQQAQALGLNVMIRSSTDQMHNLAVQGPKSRNLMADIIWTPPHQTAVADLEWFRFTVGRIGGPSGAPVVVSRTGYTGELGYEVFCHPKDGEAVFDAVWTAGESMGIKPMGLLGLDLVRIESGLVFADYEFCSQTDPFEAGIAFTVPLKSKTGDFIGRTALQRRKEAPARKLVGLDLTGQEPAAHGDPVFQGRAQIGEITSAMYSPRLARWIALARVDVTQAEIGTELEIGQLDGGIKRIPAQVVPFPHYDPKKTRPRS